MFQFAIGGSRWISPGYPSMLLNVLGLGLETDGPWGEEIPSNSGFLDTPVR